MNSSFSVFRSLVSCEEVSGPVLAAVVIDIVVVVILRVETGLVYDVVGALVVVTHSGLSDSPSTLKCSSERWAVDCLF